MGVRHVDAETVKAYAMDSKNLLEEADIVESKTFLRSFVKRIEINKKEGVIHYGLPMPRGENAQTVGVLPMITPSEPFETVPELLFEKKGLIPELQRLLVSADNA